MSQSNLLLDDTFAELVQPRKVGYQTIQILHDIDYIIVLETRPWEPLGLPASRTWRLHRPVALLRFAKSHQTSQFQFSWEYLPF